MRLLTLCEGMHACMYACMRMFVLVCMSGYVVEPCAQLLKLQLCALHERALDHLALQRRSLSHRLLQLLHLECQPNCCTTLQ